MSTRVYSMWLNNQAQSDMTPEKKGRGRCDWSMELHSPHGGLKVPLRSVGVASGGVGTKLENIVFSATLDVVAS